MIPHLVVVEVQLNGRQLTDDTRYLHNLVVGQVNGVNVPQTTQLRRKLSQPVAAQTDHTQRTQLRNAFWDGH